MSRLINLTIKTLNRETIQLEIDENESISDLKNLLFKLLKKPILPGQQNLIYAGRVLFDDDRLSEYNIDERKFLIVMNKPEIKSSPNEDEKQSFEMVTQQKNVDNEFCTINKYYEERKILEYSFVRAEVKLRILRNNRNYQDSFREAHMRPERIGNIFYRLKREDPQLFQYLQNNLDEFLYLLGLHKEDMESNIIDNFLTPIERLTVKRITGLGFKLKDILRVFFKYNKDEQKTVDYLFKTMEEDNSQS